MNQKNQKGITLIALVITIIVLLILAGVTISMVLGDDGIIAQAQEAKKAQESGTGRDEGAISQAEGILSYYNMEKYDASKNGGIAKQNSTINGEKASSTNPVIPKGFKHLLGTVDEGFVIQDEEGNEFVWIPVENTATFTTPTDFGSKFNMIGYAPGTEPALTVDEGGSAYEDAVEANRKAILDDGYENTTAGLLKQYTDEYNAMLKSVKTYGGFYVGRYETGWNEGEGVVVSKPGVPMTDITDLASVGWLCFYDENFETLGTKATLYGLYAKQKELYKKNSSSSVVSGMIYGCQWDAIMNWMLSDEDTASFVLGDATKGNYGGTPANTGTSGYDVKNIFDLGGNYWEFTQEAGEMFGRMRRGGAYNTAAYCTGAYFRDIQGPDYATTGEATSRLQLYIK